MLQKILYIAPELTLLAGIINIYLRHLIEEDSPKIMARIARVWLLISLFFTILLYNRSNNPVYLMDNAYTLLFKIIIFMFSYALLVISAQYFTAEKKVALRFYTMFLLSLIVMNIMLAAVNVLILSACVLLLMFTTHRLSEMSDEKTALTQNTRYLSANVVILLMLLVGTVGIYILSGGQLNYQNLNLILSEHTSSFYLYIYVVCLIIPFLYSLGIAPFHSYAEDKTGKVILPVSHYIAIILPWAYWGAFIKLNIEVLPPFVNELSPAYVCFALLSIGFGAVGANARINLHRIYAFCTMYYFGTVLLLLSSFNHTAYYAAFISLLVCLLGLNGAYLVFYSLKSRNEYLSASTSLSGLAKTRPYTTAVLLISLFSLTGLPPLAGFLGQASLASELISTQSYVSLFCVFFFLLMLAKVYLEIIKTAYFEQKIMAFDTENKLLKFYMLINIVCLFLLAFNPFNVIEKLKDMFDVVFL